MKIRYRVVYAQFLKSKLEGGYNMKITTFNPQIITKNAEPIVKLFEKLGFEKRHNPKGIGELDV